MYPWSLHDTRPSAERPAAMWRALGFAPHRQSSWVSPEPESAPCGPVSGPEPRGGPRDLAASASALCAPCTPGSQSGRMDDQPREPNPGPGILASPTRTSRKRPVLNSRNPNPQAARPGLPVPGTRPLRIPEPESPSFSCTGPTHHGASSPAIPLLADGRWAEEAARYPGNCE